MGIMGVMGIIKVVKNRYSVAKTKSQSLQNTSSVVGENEPFSIPSVKAETERVVTNAKNSVRQIPTKQSQNQHPISAPKSNPKKTKKSPTLEVGQGKKKVGIAVKKSDAKHS